MDDLWKLLNLGAAVDVIYSFFIGDITSALEEASSSLFSKFKKHANFKRKDLRPLCPWWNKECNNLVMEKKKALKIFKQTFSREDFLNYKKRRLVPELE